MEHGFWLLLATLATSLVYYLGSLRRRRQVSPRLPPGPRPLPVIGNALHLRRGQLHHALARLARTHGPVMRLQLGPIPAVVISSRDAAMEAFTKHDRRLTGRPTLDAIRALGWADRSVINSPSSDPLWRAQRGILAAHAFSPRSLAAARGVHERKVRDMVGYLRARSGKEVDVGRALYGGVINLVSSSFFSTDVVDMGDAAGESAHGIRELVENISHLVTKPNISDLVPFLRPFDLQGLRRAAARYLGEIFGIVDGIIERRLAENTSSGSGDKKHGDFLQVLIDLMSTGDIDRDTAKALVFELFLAGGETITVTVEWAMAELLRNPRVMAKLHAEINGALGGKGVIEEPDVARLPYLQAVVKEAMRLHAAAPLLVPHRAVEDGVEICGYAVPKGTTVFVNVWAIMRDPSLWDKPEEFVPERFMGRAAGMDYKGNHFEFIPLGSGRRQCPGLPVAECVVPTCWHRCCAVGINSVENNHDLRRRQPPSSIAPDIFSVAVASTTSKWPPAKAAPRKMEHGQVWLLCATLAVSLLYYLSSFRRRQAGSGRRLPPGPRPLPVIGNALDLRGNLHHTLARLARTYGPVMSLQLGPVPAVAISSRDAAMEAFTKHDRRLAGRHTVDAVRALGWADLSVVNMPSSDPLWKLQRGILAAHVFSPRSLAAARGVRERKVRELAGYFRARAGKEVDVGRGLYGGLVNLVSSAFFSVDVVDMEATTSESAHGIREHVENIAHLITKANISDLFPFLRPLDLQGLRRAAARHLGEIHRIVDGIIERRVAEDAAASGDGCSQHDDFLQVLLDLMSTGKIDRDTVKAIVFEIFLTGAITTTVTVEWAMAELLRNPSTMAKLRAEISGALGGKETIDEADVAGLPYLQAVVKEALRLHPAAPLMVPHKAIDDSVEVCGYAVPKGCTVFINVWAIMRDPALWDSPEEFLPERFLGKAAEVDFKGKDFEFIPFGYGRRQCPGIPLAERVVPHLLASLLHAFEWRLPEGMSAEQLNVSERFTTGNVLAVPLWAVPTPTVVAT
nr:unnamed protein product [Digitaria exilis]